MGDGAAREITQILRDWNAGDEQAKELLLHFVYDELKRQARFLMSRERSNHTLQPTALVHEAYLKLGTAAGITFQNRSHFYAIAAQLMRQVLVDHARRCSSSKRGGRIFRQSTDDLELPVEERAHSIVAIDDALKHLARLDGRQAQIVEMRFFGGMTNTEIADSLGVSERTVGREWQAAKLWLFRELTRSVR